MSEGADRAGPRTTHPRTDTLTHTQRKSRSRETIKPHSPLPQSNEHLLAVVVVCCGVRDEDTVYGWGTEWQSRVSSISPRGHNLARPLDAGCSKSRVEEPSFRLCWFSISETNWWWFSRGGARIKQSTGFTWETWNGMSGGSSYDVEVAGIWRWRR